MAETSIQSTATVTVIIGKEVISEVTMRVAHIYSLLAALRAGSYAAAAPLLHLETGSAVGKHVRKLGKHCGAQLVAIKDGRLQLTPAGAELMPHLLEIVAADTAIEALRLARRSSGMPASA